MFGQNRSFSVLLWERQGIPGAESICRFYRLTWDGRLIWTRRMEFVFTAGNLFEYTGAMEEESWPV